MTKFKIDRTYKRPTWEEVDAHSFGEYLEKVGAKHKIVTGGVGYSGEKVHAHIIYYIKTPKGIAVLDAQSLCGSGTQWSLQYPFLDTNLSKVNCKKCLKYIQSV